MPQAYSDESLALLAALRTLWRLSYQELQDWHSGSALRGASHRRRHVR